LLYWGVESSLDRRQKKQWQEAAHIFPYFILWKTHFQLFSPQQVIWLIPVFLTVLSLASVTGEMEPIPKHLVRKGIGIPWILTSLRWVTPTGRWDLPPDLSSEHESGGVLWVELYSLKAGEILTAMTFEP
jgi:hypothetical protein